MKDGSKEVVRVRTYLKVKSNLSFKEGAFDRNNLSREEFKKTSRLMGVALRFKDNGEVKDKWALVESGNYKLDKLINKNIIRDYKEMIELYERKYEKALEMRKVI